MCIVNLIYVLINWRFNVLIRCINNIMNVFYTYKLSLVIKCFIIVRSMMSEIVKVYAVWMMKVLGYILYEYRHIFLENFNIL